MAGEHRNILQYLQPPSHLLPFQSFHSCQNKVRTILCLIDNLLYIDSSCIYVESTLTAPLFGSYILVEVCLVPALDVVILGEGLRLPLGSGGGGAVDQASVVEGQYHNMRSV